MSQSVERVICIDDSCHDGPFPIDVDVQLLEAGQKQGHRKIQQAFELRLHGGGCFVGRPTSPTVQGQANDGDVPEAQQFIDRRRRSIDRQRNVIRRQKLPCLGGPSTSSSDRPLRYRSELVHRPIDQWQRWVERRTSVESPVVERGDGRSHLLANCRDRT